MGTRALLAVAAALLLTPTVAFAGAPNYDCVAGGNARLSIDQWAQVIAATGVEHKSTLWGTATNVNQDGGSLDVVAALPGTSWSVAVREYKSLLITRPSGTLRGQCEFVPGNYVLRPADSGGFALRAGPSSRARRLLVIPHGTAVWQIPDEAVKRHWFPVRTFVAHDGKIRAVDGWLRQRKPLVPRYR